MSCFRCKNDANYQVSLQFCSSECTAEHLNVKLSDLVLIDGEKRKKEEQEEKRKKEALELNLEILDLSNRRLLRLQVQYAMLSNIMARDTVFQQFAQIYFSQEITNLYYPVVAKRKISAKWQPGTLGGSEEPKELASGEIIIIRKDQEWSDIRSLFEVRMSTMGIANIEIYYEYDAKQITRMKDLNLFDFSKMNQTRFVAIQVGGFAESKTKKILPFGHAFMLFVDTVFKEAVILEPNAKKGNDDSPTVLAFYGVMYAIKRAFSSLSDFSGYTFFNVQDLLTDTEGPQAWSARTNKPRESCQLDIGYCVSVNFLWVETFARNAKEDIPISKQVQPLTKRLKEVIASWPTLTPWFQPMDLFADKTEAQGGAKGDVHMASYASWLTDKVFSILLTNALDGQELIKWSKKRKEENIQDWLPAFLSDPSLREKTERAAVAYIKAASQ